MISSKCCLASFTKNLALDNSRKLAGLPPCPSPISLQERVCCCTSRRTQFVLYALMWFLDFKFTQSFDKYLLNTCYMSYAFQGTRDTYMYEYERALMLRALINPMILQYRGCYERKYVAHLCEMSTFVVFIVI